VQISGRPFTFLGRVVWCRSTAAFDGIRLNMAHTGIEPVASLDRMLVGLLWGTDGLQRGYTLIPRVTAGGLFVAGVAATVFFVQFMLLPQHKPWPVKLIGALNFVALVAGISCYRRKAWVGLRAVLAGAAIYMAVICAVVWFGGFVPRLTLQQAIRVAGKAVAATDGDVISLDDPQAVVRGEGGGRMPRKHNLPG